MFYSKWAEILYSFMHKEHRPIHVYASPTVLEAKIKNELLLPGGFSYGLYISLATARTFSWCSLNTDFTKHSHAMNVSE